MPQGSSTFLGEEGGNRTFPQNSTSSPQLLTSDTARQGIVSPTQLALNKVAGAITFEQGSSTVVRFAESGTGHLYETTLETGILKRLTNTTIPKVEEAVWVERGRGVILRYLSDTGTIKTFYGKAPTSATSTDQPLTGSFLPDGITELISLGDGSTIFYLTPANDGIEGYIATSVGGNKTKVFSSPVRAWQVREVDKDTVLLYPNASWLTSGITGLLNVRTQRIEYFLGGTFGLTAHTNPKRDITIFSKREGSSLSLYALNRAENETVALSPSALPEKCVWSKIKTTIVYCAIGQEPLGENMPDVWYRGSTGFTDDIWSMDTSIGGSSVASELSSIAVIDATNLFLDRREGYLFFTNRKDRTLWVTPLQP